MKTMKKIVAILAVALMLMSALPMAVMAADTEIVFNLGANGSASHYDGSGSQTTYSETNGDYTLSITGGTNLYTGARDAKGNSCLKLGTSKKTGGFSFTVPDEVTSVIIAAGKYKSNATKLAINGTNYTLSSASDNGAYDEIIVDTTSTKTITLTTVASNYRAMINSITFVVAAAEGGCDHDWELISTTDATCTAEGEKYYECAACGESKTETVDALGHSYGEATETVAPDCTNAGEQQSTCSVCGDVKTETVKALGHDFVDGYCSVCGEEQPLEATITFDSTDKRTAYSTTAQVWEENGITVTNNKASSTTAVADYAKPARFYKSSQLIVAYDGMIKIEFACNTTEYATNLKNSIGADATADGKVVTVTFAEPTDEFTISLTGGQVRMDGLTVYAEKACEHVYDNDFDTDCNKCGEVRAVVAPIAGKGTSISEDVNGVAAKFRIAIDGLAVKEGTTNEADYTNATVNGYKVISMGVIASNSKSSVDISCKYLVDLEADSAEFAARVIKIPEAGYGVEITFQSYVIVEIDGVATTIYGEAVTGTYNQYAG